MLPEQLTQLLAFALAAMKTGSQIAAAATPGIQHDAHNLQLQAALAQHAATAQHWAARIDQALGEVGGTAAPVNHILTAHYEVDQRIRQFTAGDAQVRDLSIIASGQRALHYWISFFDSVRAYAAPAGRAQMAREMQASREEARQADAQYSQLAAQLLSV